MNDNILFIVGALLHGHSASTLDDKQITETVRVAVKVVAEIQKQVCKVGM
jgi:hypothetical protein